MRSGDTQLPRSSAIRLLVLYFAVWILGFLAVVIALGNEGKRSRMEPVRPVKVARRGMA